MPNKKHKNTMPLVSIIVPTYNREKLIGETIERVFSQSYTNWELIIVNDGSVDNTVEIIQEFKTDKIRLFTIPHSGKIAKVRNYGMKFANGKYIAVLDSDDLWRDDKLEIQVTCFQSDNKIKYILSSGEQFGINPVKVPIYESYIGNLFKLLVIEQKYPILTSSLIFDVIASKEVGNLNESWGGVADINYIYHLAYLFTGAYIGERLVHYRKHEGNRHLIYKNTMPEMLEMYRCLHENGMLSEPQAENLSNNIIKKIRDEELNDD